VLALVRGDGFTEAGKLFEPTNIRLFKPKAASRPPPPPEVPKKVSQDYVEACSVVSDILSVFNNGAENALEMVSLSTVPKSLAEEILRFLQSGGK